MSVAMSGSMTAAIDTSSSLIEGRSISVLHPICGNSLFAFEACKAMILTNATLAASSHR
jgi:hypothetical protein